MSSQPLYYFAREGLKHQVVRLLDEGVDVDDPNEKDDDWCTALHWASEKGYNEIVKLLLEKAADVNARDIDGSTSLHKASKKGHVEVIKLLLDKAADINAKDGCGATPLYEALMSSYFYIDTEVVDLLLAKGADVDAKDANGCTPLHKASCRGSTHFVRFLLNKGANVNAKEKNGWTPLHEAVYNDNEDVFKLLLSKGADINAKDAYGDMALDLTKKDVYDSITVSMMSSEQSPFMNDGGETTHENDIDAPNQPDRVAIVENSAESSPVVDTHDEEIENWLSKFLRNEGDAKKYRDCLVKDGFDTMEIVRELKEGDLYFMKNGHKSITLKKLAELGDE